MQPSRSRFQLPGHAPAQVLLHWRGRTRHCFLRPGAVLAGIAIALCLTLLTATGAFLHLTADGRIENERQRHAVQSKAYERRIAALREELDATLSRQLLRQQTFERRLQKLYERHDSLRLRAGGLSKVRGDDRRSSIAAPSSITTARSTDPGTGLRLAVVDPRVTGGIRPWTPSRDPLDQLEGVIAETEGRQIAELQRIRQRTAAKVQRLAGILKRQGKAVPAPRALGGPLIQLKTNAAFLDATDAVREAQETLRKVRRAALHLPHGSPVPGKRISSRFGHRRDPFTGRRALHGGLDYAARRGTPVRATAAGKVVRAGRSGGYGKLVEIDHGGGITTRYAHLHRIHVKKGQRIARGRKIGQVGSTGRSTGPHLHYEVRRKGRVLNPITYVRLAKELAPLLK